MSCRARETRIKQPAESRLYSIDFGELLASTETISSVTSVTATPTGSGHLTLGTGTISGETVQVRISGGEAGQQYRIECIIVTSLSNTLEGDAILVVED